MINQSNYLGTLNEYRKYVPAWLRTRPMLDRPTGDSWDDALSEYQLIKKLNKAGNEEAKRKFIDVYRMLDHKLSDKERAMLKLVDFYGNESLEWLMQPGMVTAMGILRDSWPRWFGGKANLYARFNPDIYWIPWSYFMEDDKVAFVKNDLIANLFNDAAKKALWEVLYKTDNLINEITHFDFTSDEPLMWNALSHQSRPVDYYWNISAPMNPKYWALGNFSINALSKAQPFP